jgi:hypothetical protein
MITAPFRIDLIPLPWWYAVQFEDGSTVWETATGQPVTRWRTEWIVPAPGRIAVAK